MSFYKEQGSYDSSKRYSKKNSKYDDNFCVKDEKHNTIYEEFLQDWEKLRVRNVGQQEILDQVFINGKRYIFARIGRKGSKTTTNIDISWKFSMRKALSTTYICSPTITQCVEIYWDEKRLQWCDSTNDDMSKYIKHVDNKNHMITFVNNSTIKLVGTWSEARGRGTQPNLMIVDEIQDASADYLDAMEPNLAAKTDSLCIMTGTPPKKKNHYHEWENRIKNNPEGFHVKYSSYMNTALPHLKGWLDNKKIELIAAGKEDVWLREYMAEDCFRSDDRVLPDICFTNFDDLLYTLKAVDASSFQPVFGLVVTEHHMTATYNVIHFTRFTGTKIYTLESHHLSRIWDKSYREIYSEMTKKMEEYSSTFKKSWRKVIFDQTESFSDVISGVSQCRNDLKWTKRGIPLLKELILDKRLVMSSKSSDIGVEAQNLLKEDDIRDYPLVCAMAMIANEYYQAPAMSRHEQEHWDKMAPLREAGLITNLPRQKQLRPYFGNSPTF
jgi:hypothetical protein